MESARQVLRWSIPGSLFIAVFLALHVFYVAVTHSTSPLLAVKGISAPGAITLIFSGIPAGFVIYQLYYARYCSSYRFPRHPHSLRGRRIPQYTLFLRRDRGGAALLEYLKEGGEVGLLQRIAPPASPISKQQLQRLHRKVAANTTHLLRPLKMLELRSHICDDKTDVSWRACDACHRAYDRLFVRNWRIYQAFIDLVATRPELASVKAEYTSGSDLYHSMGASRRAISLACAGVIAYELTASLTWDTGASLLGRASIVWFVAVLAVWLLLGMTLTACRRNTDDNFRRRIATHLAVISREYPSRPWAVDAHPHSGAQAQP